jgi:hypothetical protein
MARSRTYSDADLANAVLCSRSWREVLRTLGLRATSSSAIRSVRRRTDLLGLDHAHFTGNRRWTHAQLAEAVDAAASWPEVAEKLGLVADSTTTLRGHAARLGLDVRHLSAGPDLSQHPFEMSADLAHLRRAGSLLAASWFTLCGFEVSWPLEPCRYDLLVRMRDGIARVQVKTATRRDGQSWVVWLSTTGRRRATYDPDEIEYFFVVDADLTYYLIPFSVVGGLHAIHLSSYAGYRVGGAPSRPGSFDDSRVAPPR